MSLCLPGYSVVSFSVSVTPGAIVRFVPETVDCDDPSFPLPWSNPIFGPADFVAYQNQLNAVLEYDDHLNSAILNPIANLWTLRLNPSWTELFGGCDAKLKICVAEGVIEDVTFPEGNRLECCPDPTLEPCQCETSVLLPFKIKSFAPPLVPFNGYVVNWNANPDDCGFSGDSIIIPPWLSSSPEAATVWLAKVLNIVIPNPEISACDFDDGFVALSTPRTPETEAFCNTPFYHCVGYRVPGGGSPIPDDTVITIKYYLSAGTNSGLFYCCEPPPPPPVGYPPNHCLPSCGCERACDAVGCFDELAVRLKSGLTGFPPPGTQVTVLVQEGYRKTILTGTYDGTGVKVTLTPQQKKFFMYFRAYSVAVFWNGQIWPMADNAQCKYFVAYPGPPQTTLTI